MIFYVFHIYRYLLCANFSFLINFPFLVAVIWGRNAVKLLPKRIKGHKAAGMSVNKCHGRRASVYVAVTGQCMILLLSMFCFIS